MNTTAMQVFAQRVILKSYEHFETYCFFTTGSAQITCYTVPSVDGEFNCLPTTPNFQAATIEGCCSIENTGHFFKEGEDEACQACIGMERNKYLSLHIKIPTKPFLSIPLFIIAYYYCRLSDTPIYTHNTCGTSGSAYPRQLCTAEGHLKSWLRE